MSQIPGVADLGTFQVRGQPNVNLVVDRAAADRFGINVSDIQDAVETAVGGKAVSQILISEQRYDLTVRYQPQFRQYRGGHRQHSHSRALRRARVPGPADATSRSMMARPPFIAKATPATSPSNTACAGAIWAARCGRPLKKSGRKSNFPRAITSTGPANTKASSAPTAVWPSSSRSRCC